MNLEILKLERKLKLQNSLQENNKISKTNRKVKNKQTQNLPERIQLIHLGNNSNQKKHLMIKVKHFKRIIVQQRISSLHQTIKVRIKMSKH